MGKESMPDLLPDGGGSRHSSAPFGVSSFESSSITAHCNRCSARVSRALSFRCVSFLAVSVFLLVSGILLIIHPSFSKHSNNSLYDASESTKLDASVHASFQLQRQVEDLIPEIVRLEYDIYNEIGLPNTKVAILSIHPSEAPNITNVIFGVLPNPLNSPISEVSLSILRSSMVDLFRKESNLTLTNSTFGQAFTFEILKFPGGVTVIPDLSSFSQLPRVFFNFTLNISISEISDNLSELKVELQQELRLNPYEVTKFAPTQIPKPDSNSQAVFVLVTSTNGSTVSPPVVVQASVVSNYGMLLPQRLRQLAETIRKSPGKNLGLDHSIFGKVKSIILSSYLQGTLEPTTPIALPPSYHGKSHAPPPSYRGAESPQNSPYLHSKNPHKSHHRAFPPRSSPPAKHSPRSSLLPEHSRRKPGLKAAQFPPPKVAPLPSHGSAQTIGASIQVLSPSPLPSSSSRIWLGKFWLCCVCGVTCLLLNGKGI